MVYCGKPSRCCRQCRNRHIKCDKKTPSCGQCLRTSLECPGYHNPEHLIFRDQTQTTILKITEQEKDPPSPLQPLPPLEPSVFIRAKQLFVNRHVLEPSSRLGFLTPYRPPRRCDASFSIAVKAVMFACFFHEVQCASVLRLARKNYSSALVLLRWALRSRDAVARDETIASVLLLDMFERFMAREGLAEAPATNHLQGAIAIFKLRGGKQFANPATLTMFRYLSLSHTLSCLNRCTRIPDDALHLRDQACKYVEPDDYEWQFMDLMIRLAQLKAALREGSISGDDVLLALHDLDYDYHRLTCGSPELLHENMSGHTFPYTAPKRYEITCPGIGPLETNHIALVRDLLEELLQQNIPKGHDVSTATQSPGSNS